MLPRASSHISPSNQQISLLPSSPSFLTSSPVLDSRISVPSKTLTARYLPSGEKEKVGHATAQSRRLFCQSFFLAPASKTAMSPSATANRAASPDQAICDGLAFSSALGFRSGRCQYISCPLAIPAANSARKATAKNKELFITLILSKNETYPGNYAIPFFQTAKSCGLKEEGIRGTVRWIPSKKRTTFAGGGNRQGPPRTRSQGARSPLGRSARTWAPPSRPPSGRQPGQESPG